MKWGMRSKYVNPYTKHSTGDCEHQRNYSGGSAYQAGSLLAWMEDALSVVYNTVLFTCMNISFWINVFIFLGEIPSSRITGSSDISIFSLLHRGRGISGCYCWNMLSHWPGTIARGMGTFFISHECRWKAFPPEGHKEHVWRKIYHGGTLCPEMRP